MSIIRWVNKQKNLPICIEISPMAHVALLHTEINSGFRLNPRMGINSAGGVWTNTGYNIVTINITYIASYVKPWHRGVLSSISCSASKTASEDSIISLIFSTFPAKVQRALQRKRFKEIKNHRSPKNTWTHSFHWSAVLQCSEPERKDKAVTFCQMQMTAGKFIGTSSSQYQFKQGQ